MSGHSPHGNNLGYETRDVTFNVTIWVIPASMILLAVYAAVCYFYTTAVLTREMVEKQARGAEIADKTFTAFETKEAASMHQYEWKDKGKGMVEIPIERAMQMMVQNANAVRPADSAPTKTQ